MFDPTKPYQRRDGKYALIIHTKTDGSFVVLSENESVYICEKNGLFVPGKKIALDLVNTPEKIEGWINIYKFSTLYATEEEAQDNADSDVFARIYVKVAKGEGL